MKIKTTPSAIRYPPMLRDISLSQRLELQLGLHLRLIG